MFIFLKINKMTENTRKNLFKLEEQEFDVLEEKSEPVIKQQNSKKKVKLYPISPKVKSNKIKAKRKPRDMIQDSDFILGDIKSQIELEAKDYPGEIVNHSDHYFISLQKDGQFSWFLLK